jgi:leucyl-tRNA synthetase
MFLGPLTQHKPWDTQGISGVHNFLRRLSRLYAAPTDGTATEAAQRTLHRTVAKVTDDLDRHAFNTVVSALMIAVNELTEAGCSDRVVLRPLSVLLSPYAPHLAEWCWAQAGGSGSVLDAVWPVAEARWLEVAEVNYPISFNGKVRFQLAFPASADAGQIEAEVRIHERTQAQLSGAVPKKVIVIPGRIVNIVV